MAKGRKRRRVTWRTGGSQAHAFVELSSTSACDGWKLIETGRVEGGEERCRNCEIALDQLW